MNKINKYILLYTSFILLLTIIMFGTEDLQDINIAYQKNALIKQARTHFQDQVNNRKWNSQYGGVYVKAKNGLKPNPYLKNNIIKTEDGQTLIKINPAWMTRQLSEISDLDDFHFRIISLDPINPQNKADAFETRALKYIEKTLDKEYFEITDKGNFRYMGALVTTASCIPCHKDQNYIVGDVKGGISISLDAREYNKILDYIHKKVFLLRVFIVILLLSIVSLLHKQIKNNQNLKEEVDRRTKEILSTKILLQEVIDADLSFLMVSDGIEIILANKTMLNFFGFDSLEKFRKEHIHVSNSFVSLDDENFLSTYIDGVHWIKYLQKEQKHKELKILMLKNNTKRYFKPHTKKVIIDNKELHIIIFDDITKELKNIKILKDKAAKDALTNLFNKGKFNDVLEKEIDLSNTTLSPLSIIFLDIDHFKIVNDTYGHDAGDYVLVELSKILLTTVRKGDFVARWGGEEFVITLQSTSTKEASILAEKIRQRVQKYDFKKGGKQAISLGVTQYITNENQDAMMKRVDEALYEAKRTGRNKVITN